MAAEIAEEEKIERWREEAKKVSDEAIAARKVKHKVWFEISVQDDYKDNESASEVMGNLEIDLFDNQPDAVENFRAHCTGEKGTYEFNDKETRPLHFKNCTFFRILKDKFMQSGDTGYNNGVGGHSIFGDKTFKDEKTIEGVN